MTEFKYCYSVMLKLSGRPEYMRDKHWVCGYVRLSEKIREDGDEHWQLVFSSQAVDR